MLCLCSILLVICSVANGALVPQLDGRIVGGVDVEIEKHPYQLSMLRGPVHMCGGSVISEYWAITAAHCVDHRKVSLVSFRAGSSTRGSGGSTHEATQIVIPDKYFASNNHDYDYALIKVRNPFPIGTARVRTIELATVEPQAGDLAVVTGWGALSSGGSIPTQLQKVTVPIVSRDQCRLMYGSTITERMICAGYDHGGKDSCQGDSGGPLVVHGKLAGIVSWGRGCALAYYPGVYANIAAKRDWIREVTGI